MQQTKDLPESIKQAHRSLESYVKPGQEVANIRRVLALHLASHVIPQTGCQISSPLSLVGAQSDVKQASSGVRGIRREYLRCVRANAEAREEYEKISRQHQHPANPDNKNVRGGTHDHPKDGAGISLESFLDVVMYRRKHERLRILQDYVDVLAQKRAASADHFDPGVVLKDVDSLPPVPTEVMGNIGGRQEFERTDLNELVERLEKSVFRARVLFQREQNLLAKVKADGQSRKNPSTSSGARLQALGTARNELINWIETELAKAGECPVSSNHDQDFKGSEREGKDDIDSQLTWIQSQYTKYTKSRQALILAATGVLEAPAPAPMDNDAGPRERKEEIDIAASMNHIFQPYLEDLTSISNEQKSMIQQKSHLTISLAKQLKEAGQGMDRLAEESHLLPSYPLSIGDSQRKGLEAPISFGDEISNHEKPDSSRRARAWVFASDSASKATKDAVSENLGEGEMSILDACQTLLELRRLLGEDAKEPIENRGLVDIWETLDGRLGVIARDDGDKV